ncbi:MAG: hypothetical protein ACOC96_02720 [Actinomycetota bacterium]
MNDAHALPTSTEALINRARRLSDEDRLCLAEARAALDETFHAGAWNAANEIAAQRSRDHRYAWVRIGAAFIPDRLDELVRTGTADDRAEVAKWQDVARRARLAIDDALLALAAADLLRPPDLRELYGPWKAMLEAAHETAATRSS